MEMLYQHYFLTLLGHQKGLELNGTNQLLVSADDGNILGKNTNTVKKNTRAVLRYY
jgi:hypothetical protein